MRCCRRRGSPSLYQALLSGAADLVSLGVTRYRIKPYAAQSASRNLNRGSIHHMEVEHDSILLPYCDVGGPCFGVGLHCWKTANAETPATSSARISGLSSAGDYCDFVIDSDGIGFGCRLLCGTRSAHVEPVGTLPECSYSIRGLGDLLRNHRRSYVALSISISLPFDRRGRKSDWYMEQA